MHQNVAVRLCFGGVNLSASLSDVAVVAGAVASPSGCKPMRSGSRIKKREHPTISTAPTTAISGSVERQPIRPTSAVAIGGTTRLPTEPPLDPIPTARPRRRTNQRTTVALQGTQAALMPMAETTPRVVDLPERV
jgi:hypothetical protein